MPISNGRLHDDTYTVKADFRRFPFAADYASLQSQYAGRVQSVLEGNDAVAAHADWPDDNMSDIRLRILDSALHVFAAKGFEATTIREITKRAGVNIAAVNYHFKSKAELFRAVLFHTLGPLNRQRSEGLDRLLSQRTDGYGDVPDLLHALLEPLVRSRRNEQGEWIVVRLLQQVRLAPSSTTLLSEQFDAVAHRYIDALAAATPALTRSQVVFRYEFARGAAMQILGDLSDQSSRFSRLANDQAPDVDDILDELISFAAKGFS